MARAELPDQNSSFHNARAVRPRLHKEAVVQPPEPGRAFKGLGVAERVAPRIVRIYTLRGFESVLAGSVQPGLLGDELA